MRLILDGFNRASWNMAVDEAVLRHRKEMGTDTLRLYSWEPSAVSIGYFQELHQEVDVDYCREHGIDVVRRITGGGAVYHDRDGEVTYSIVTSLDEHRLGNTILSSYEVICRGIILGLKELGVEAAFSPVNDIVVSGKKISGNAQTRRFGGILQHGTILYDVKPEVMFSVLKVPEEKIRDKMIKNVFERVTSLRREGVDAHRKEVMDALVKGFSQALGEDMEPGELTPEETETAREIEREKYDSWDWTARR